MLGTILNAEEFRTTKGTQYIKLTVEVDNDIVSILLTLTSKFHLENVCYWCKVPVLFSSNLNLLKIQHLKFINKVIPVHKQAYMNRRFWHIDHRQIQINNFENYLRLVQKWSIIKSRKRK